MIGFSSEALDAANKNTFKVKKDNLNNKRARDIISSFLNAWKTSKIIPDYGRNRNENNRFLGAKLTGKQNGFQLDKLDFLGQRKSQLDAPSFYALQNSFNPKPIKKVKARPSSPEAETFLGKETYDESDDRSPELKLASLISKPIYHTMPYGHGSENDLKQFMFGSNEGVNENRIGLPNEEWQANLMSRRSFTGIPGSVEKNTEIESYTDNNEAKRGDIMRGVDLDVAYRKDEIPSDARMILEQLERRNIYNQIGDKKELITDPYDSLSLPVSEFLNRQESDRKFYKSLPDNMIDEYETRELPAQFKLQKNPLWGNIQKRWRRSKVNRKNSWPVQEELNIRGVPRSLGIGLGETGNSYDAYGQIGQNMEQSLMRLNGDKPGGCAQDQTMKFEPISTHGTTPTALFDGADVQQDFSRQTDNGIIKISPPQRRRSTITSYRSMRDPTFRHKRSLYLLRKRAIRDALSKKSKGLFVSLFLYRQRFRTKYSTDCCAVSRLALSF